MLISDAVHIWRVPEGDYHVEWQTSSKDTEVSVEALAEGGPVSTEYRAPEGEHAAYRATVSGLPLGRRHFFRLRDQHGNEVLAAERRLGLQGSPNFRDFGGYRNTEGQQVKWGYLFRSGHLAKLSDEDIALLASLELDLVFDFRQQSEQLSEPSRLPSERPPLICSLPIAPGNNSGFLQSIDGVVPSSEAMFEFMVTVNRELALEEAGVYRRMFEEILAQDSARYLVHCAAGKDRTGFASALMLLALGVPESLVLRDYLLSARFFKPEVELEKVRAKYRLSDSDREAIMPMLQVDEAYLRAALEGIHSNFPSIEAYLSEMVGLGRSEIAELRGRYLQA
ncbi:tyrosine-protein phosphatase [Parahaliea sp. F7430]|uniref:Tyrosine-protein phosphatase n=1 Tax=Sediminihaliea albiluteola TaxID=2758564 RepID=A0A7W2TWH9_9GAMM|nr:tyrosine-protein phosphatase [Sediminihaliea albiluteola]MBA6413247.1 tyrosine-protein phosphatase [Sediminihaliea albiluteola]